MAGKRKRGCTASDPESDDDDYKRMVRRGRGQKVARLGRKGALRYIQEMPLDVVYEIFTHLEPYDLLKLSRTSQAFRNIVLNRSALTLWKNARINAGIPEPIPTMSEPAFINLLFDRRCHFCGTVAIHNNTIIWSSLSRCCKKCLAEKLEDTALNYNVNKGLPRALVNTLPRYQNPREDREFRYLKSESEKLVNEYESLPADEKEIWLSQRVEKLAQINKQVDVCKDWLSAQENKRGRELKQVRQDRLELITRKIVELGYSQVVASREEFCLHPDVKQSKALTERGWKNIQQRIEELASSIQKSLLPQYKKNRYIALRQVLRDWDYQQTSTLMTPSIRDIALWQPFKSAIEDLPLDAGCETSVFDDALTQLPSLIQEWNRNQTKKVLVALQKHQPNATEADLHLSTSLFRCASCSRSGSPFYAYPGILSHVCSTPRRFPPPVDFKPPEWYWEYDRHRYPSAITTQIEVAKSAVELTKEIGEVVGIDVASTPISTMLTLDPPVVHDSTLTTWTDVVAWEKKYQLEAPRDEDLGKSKTLEQRLLKVKSERYFLCKECPSYRSSLINVKNHLLEIHGITAVHEDHWEFSPFTSISG